jgi:hypothetical protein
VLFSRTQHKPHATTLPHTLPTFSLFHSSAEVVMLWPAYPRPCRGPPAHTRPGPAGPGLAGLPDACGRGVGAAAVQHSAECDSGSAGAQHHHRPRLQRLTPAPSPSAAAAPRSARCGACTASPAQPASGSPLVSTPSRPSPARPGPLQPAPCRHTMARQTPSRVAFSVHVPPSESRSACTFPHPSRAQRARPSIRVALSVHVPPSESRSACTSLYPSRAQHARPPSESRSAYCVALADHVSPSQCHVHPSESVPRPSIRVSATSLHPSQYRHRTIRTPQRLNLVA